MGTQPPTVAFEQNEFGLYRLLKADEVWVLLPCFAAILLAPALPADGAWLWRHRRLPQGAREYAAWLLLPPLFALPFFIVALLMPADAPFGIILAMVVTALYAGLQMFLSLLLLPCAMLFCRLVRCAAV